MFNNSIALQPTPSFLKSNTENALQDEIYLAFNPFATSHIQMQLMRIYHVYLCKLNCNTNKACHGSHSLVHLRSNGTAELNRKCIHRQQQQPFADLAFTVSL